MSLQAIRRRMPLWAFILLAVFCLGMLGLACACMTDQPAQQIDRALGAISAAPALVEVWTFAGCLAATIVQGKVARTLTVLPLLSRE